MKLSHFAFYPKDWLGDLNVKGLSLEAQGAYLKLLCLMWQAPDGSCSLPLDDAKLSKLVGVDPRRWRRLKEELWPLMSFDFAEGQVFNPRLRKEWERAQHRADRLRPKIARRSPVDRPKIAPISAYNSADKPAEKHETGGNLGGPFAHVSGAENQNQSTTNTTKRVPARKPAEPSDEAKQVAAYLANAIRSHSPEYSPRGGLEAAVANWARDIDLAIRIDKRSPDQLRRVIDFAHRNPRDTFWRANLLSGEKLRAKCADLDLRAKPAKPTPVQNYLGNYKPASEVK